MALITSDCYAMRRSLEVALLHGITCAARLAAWPVGRPTLKAPAQAVRTRCGHQTAGQSSLPAGPRAGPRAQPRAQPRARARPRKGGGLQGMPRGQMVRGWQTSVREAVELDLLVLRNAAVHVIVQSELQPHASARISEPPATERT